MENHALRQHAHQHKSLELMDNAKTAKSSQNLMVHKENALKMFAMIVRSFSLMVLART
jgi:hypothetical protein